ncbi:MAG: GNAT family N-acetyltransferase [Halioglobus sp.]
MQLNEGTDSLAVEFISSLDAIDPQDWDAVTGQDYPFLRHQFLYGLEQTGCTTAQSGWQPCHALLRQGGSLVAVMPMYLKSHSYGEYVFDWSWADAWQRSGLEYYPKLVTAIPFTPATGPRICVAPAMNPHTAHKALVDAIQDFARSKDISSWHLLFPPLALSEELAEIGTLVRTASQFHWFNEDYATFDDFLSTFSSRKRKSLKRERKRVAEQGISLTTLVGDDIGEANWQLFHHFYQMTYAKRSGHGGYLSKEFFTNVAAKLGNQVIMVLASLEGSAIAAALYFRSNDTLFGRYWGALDEFDCLHFEACYYQGIEFCIANKIKRFDPGAQGEHKIQRGFRPVRTYSNHWIANPTLSAAVADFTRQESTHTDQYITQATKLLPFKTGPE